MKTKAELVRDLTQAASNLKVVRDRAALVRDQINQIEPTPLQSAQSVLTPGAVVQGKTEG